MLYSIGATGHSPTSGARPGTCRIATRSAAAEVLVAVGDLGTLLKSDEDVEIGPFSALERDRLLDVVADAGAFLGALESDADGKRLLAEDRLIWSGHRDEILEINGIALRCRTTLTDYDRVQREAHGVAGVLASELRLAQQSVECDIVRAALGSGPKHGAVGERPQHD